MSENHHPRQPPTDHVEWLEPESALFFGGDWDVPEVQFAPVSFSANTDALSGRDELADLSAGPMAKVAIPRTTQSSSSNSSGRVSHACENCRDAKAKCSGHRPCNRCQDNGQLCSYGDRKREKMVKQLNDLTSQVETYEGLLRDLYPRLDATCARHVDQTLPAFSSLVVRPSEPVRLSSPRPSAPRVAENIPTPLGVVDHTKEDFIRDEQLQAMGFVGEHSEMAWLFRLKRDLNQASNSAPSGNPTDAPSIISVNYFQDESDISVLTDVDPFVGPPYPVAKLLTDRYFDKVHHAFPVIGKKFFLNQWESVYSNPNLRPWKPWLGVMNMVLAIASRHLLLVDDQPPSDPNEHMVYFSRAWRLSMGHTALLDHPNVMKVQFEGLTAFYLLSIGQVNRAWRMIGIAIRSAITMGLHLRSETNSIPHESKETVYRVWWALFMLDTVLCEMTGRPPSKIFSTTPLPTPFREEDLNDQHVARFIMDKANRDNLVLSLLSRGQGFWPNESMADRINRVRLELNGEEQGEHCTDLLTETLTSNISLYFLYAVDLAFLMREAIDKLYAPAANRQSWLEIENTVSTLISKADNWHSRLPLEFQFTNMDTGRPLARQRVSLAFRFYTTKLMISQPCLRRRVAHSQAEAQPPSARCDTIASTCIEMASRMLGILPDEPTDQNMALFYDFSPWWCVLHYVVQSMTVFLVKLSRTMPGSEESTSLVDKVMKATRWIRKMSFKDPFSQRAWVVCEELLSQLGLTLESDVDVGI
ncbi:hypothetical protein N7474_007186 [Penicillium riverlandense]|uniref:uncharacterized protein n=1 Tax=Penicillium riverlandense TaxID=1903569 RepID=UPI0025492F35|nr:uncharacterized protein N7474_007186 [Penicillium riverlandense]KAJ5815409.1 hypothetical protein N7474_007186 [Penicillium riverlandense]